MARIDLDLIANLPLSDARRELQKIAGVGPKVADCVLLFAYHRLDAFPVDRWVLRAMSHFYFDGNAITVEQAKREGSRRFGPFSGYAQEYLFHYTRNYCHVVLIDAAGEGGARRGTLFAATAENMFDI